jgi:arylsulfatase A-like enzyme
MASIPKITVPFRYDRIPKLTGLPFNPVAAAAERNLVVIVIDDPPLLYPQHTSLFGFDRQGYDFTPQTGDPDHLYPYTPNINALADAGVTFHEYRAMAVCSPWRASFLTGVYPFRHGMGTTVDEDHGEFEFGDFTGSWSELSGVLEQMGVATCIAGKLHLSVPDDVEFQDDVGGTGRFGQGFDILSKFGFRDERVWLRNLDEPGGLGTGGDYYWHQYHRKAEGDETATIVTVGTDGSTDADDYITTNQIDQALSFINAQSGRFFVYLPLNATHSPYDDDAPATHVSTSEYRPFGSLPGALWRSYMQQMEAVDYEIGELRSGMTAEALAKTTFVVVGDNGPEGPAYIDAQNLGKVMGDDWDAAIADGNNQFKRSVASSGTRSIFVWSGGDVVSPGRTSDVLVNPTDFHSTIREFFASGGGGTDPMPGTDGFSFRNVLTNPDVTKYSHTRVESLAEFFRPNGTPPTSLPVSGQPLDGLNRRSYVAFVDSFPDAPVLDNPTLLGQFHLIRELDDPGSTYTDTFFHTEDLNGTRVDPLDLNALDINSGSLYYEQYLLVSAGLDALLESDPPTGGTFQLPITDEDGNAAHVVLDENNRVPIKDETGTTRYINTSDGELMLTDELGNTDKVVLETT